MFSSLETVTVSDINCHNLITKRFSLLLFFANELFVIFLDICKQYDYHSTLHNEGYLVVNYQLGIKINYPKKYVGVALISISFQSYISYIL